MISSYTSRPATVAFPPLMKESPLEPKHEAPRLALSDNARFNHPKIEANVWTAPDTFQPGSTSVPTSPADFPRGWSMALLTSEGEAPRAVWSDNVDYSHPDLEANLWVADADDTAQRVANDTTQWGVRSEARFSNYGTSSTLDSSKAGASSSTSSTIAVPVPTEATSPIAPSKPLTPTAAPASAPEQAKTVSNEQRTVVPKGTVMAGVTLDTIGGGSFTPSFVPGEFARKYGHRVDAEHDAPESRKPSTPTMAPASAPEQTKAVSNEERAVVPNGTVMAGVSLDTIDGFGSYTTSFISSAVAKKYAHLINADDEATASKSNSPSTITAISPEDVDSFGRPTASFQPGTFTSQSGGYITTTSRSFDPLTNTLVGSVTMTKDSANASFQDDQWLTAP